MQVVRISRKSRALNDHREILWVNSIQAKTRYAQQFRGDIKKLNLKIDETRGIYICEGPTTDD